MNVHLTGRKFRITPTFSERTEKKLAKLDKFFNDDAVAEVLVTAERNLQRVEMMVRGNGMLLRAEESAENANDAVDILIDVLLRQIRRNKVRLAKRLRENAFEPSDMLPEDSDEEYRLVRRKSFPVKPMDVEEAILQMNLINHQFFMFRNMDSNEINVVYRRHDGNYGLLEPGDED